jgi:hypothetical protein
MGGPAVVVQSRCRKCDVLVHWRATRPRANATEFEPIDQDSNFVCDHWRQHHDASQMAFEAPEQVIEIEPVSAKVLSR